MHATRRYRCTVVQNPKDSSNPLLSSIYVAMTATNRQLWAVELVGCDVVGAILHVTLRRQRDLKMVDGGNLLVIARGDFLVNVRDTAVS